MPQSPPSRQGLDRLPASPGLACRRPADQHCDRAVPVTRPRHEIRDARVVLPWDVRRQNWQPRSSRPDRDLDRLVYLQSERIGQIIDQPAHGSRLLFGDGPNPGRLRGLYQVPPVPLLRRRVTGPSCPHLNQRPDLIGISSARYLRRAGIFWQPGADPAGIQLHPGLPPGHSSGNPPGTWKPRLPTDGNSTMLQRPQRLKEATPRIRHPAPTRPSHPPLSRRPPRARRAHQLTRSLKPNRPHCPPPQTVTPQSAQSCPQPSRVTTSRTYR